MAVRGTEARHPGEVRAAVLLGAAEPARGSFGTCKRPTGGTEVKAGQPLRPPGPGPCWAWVVLTESLGYVPTQAWESHPAGGGLGVPSLWLYL